MFTAVGNVAKKIIGKHCFLGMPSFKKQTKHEKHTFST